MRRAVKLAQQACPLPNPSVGAVFVCDGKILGEGYHAFFGGKHAEIAALDDALFRGHSLSGAELYVTLEPCVHLGKTPPCVDRLLSLGLQSVYIGVLDMNPLVSGKGISMLREHGVSVSVGYSEEEIKDILKGYTQFLASSRSFTILKNAVTLKGKITLKQSERKYLSCSEALEKVHFLRSCVDGIIVGVNTVLADDPQLTCRLFSGKNPLRIVLDTQLRSPLNAKVFVDTHCIIFCGKEFDREKHDLLSRKVSEIVICPLKDGHVDLHFVLQWLRSHGIAVVLVEGGKTLNTSLFSEGLVDKWIFDVTPLFGSDVDVSVVDSHVLGDLFTLSKNVELLSSEKVGVDTWLEFLVGS